MLAIIAALTACRGEPVPRDYQNAPPTVTSPADTKSDAPSAHGRGQAPPQPSTGVEGKTTQPVDATSPTTTLPDTPPVTTTT